MDSIRPKNNISYLVRFYVLTLLLLLSVSHLSNPWLSWVFVLAEQLAFRLVHWECHKFSLNTTPIIHLWSDMSPNSERCVDNGGQTECYYHHLCLPVERVNTLNTFVTVSASRNYSDKKGFNLLVQE